MKGWDSSNWEVLSSWIRLLEGYGIYFSSPLDLDMAMLVSFPGAYKATIPADGGPSLTPDEAVKIVLGTGGKGFDDYKGKFANSKDHMPAYRYHFLTRSKPATHLAALAQLDDHALSEGMPEVYERLVAHVDEKLNRD